MEKPKFIGLLCIVFSILCIISLMAAAYSYSIKSAGWAVVFIVITVLSLILSVAIGICEDRILRFLDRTGW